MLNGKLALVTPSSTQERALQSHQHGRPWGMLLEEKGDGILYWYLVGLVVEFCFLWSGRWLLIFRSQQVQRCQLRQRGRLLAACFFPRGSPGIPFSVVSVVILSAATRWVQLGPSPFCHNQTNTLINWDLNLHRCFLNIYNFKFLRVHSFWFLNWSFITRCIEIQVQEG